MAKKQTRKKTNNTWQVEALLVAYAVIAVAVILGGIKWFVVQQQGSGLVAAETTQAVFLENGQVVFGDLDLVNRETAVVSNAHFLQQTPGEEGADPELRVVPIEEDVHTPTSNLFVQRARILYWENLQPSSPVIEAMNELALE